jgi:hypothetical protein
MIVKTAVLVPYTMSIKYICVLMKGSFLGTTMAVSGREQQSNSTSKQVIIG